MGNDGNGFSNSHSDSRRTPLPLAAATRRTDATRRNGMAPRPPSSEPMLDRSERGPASIDENRKSKLREDAKGLVALAENGDSLEGEFKKVVEGLTRETDPLARYDYFRAARLSVMASKKISAGGKLPALLPPLAEFIGNQDMNIRCMVLQAFQEHVKNNGILSEAHLEGLLGRLRDISLDNRKIAFETLNGYLSGPAGIPRTMSTAGSELIKVQEKLDEGQKSGRVLNEYEKAIRCLGKNAHDIQLDELLAALVGDDLEKNGSALLELEGYARSGPEKAQDVLWRLQAMTAKNKDPLVIELGNICFDMIASSPD